jgi:hypothetical protein
MVEVPSKAEFDSAQAANQKTDADQDAALKANAEKDAAQDKALADNAKRDDAQEDEPRERSDGPETGGANWRRSLGAGTLERDRSRFICRCAAPVSAR